VRTLRILLAVLLIGCSLGAAWLTLTPSGNRLRYLAADTLITTQHRHWAKFIIGEEALNRRLEDYERQFDTMAKEELHPVTVTEESDAAHEIGDAASDDGSGKQETRSEQDSLYRVEPISGEGWQGYLLIVPDPLSIRIGIPNTTGRGEKVSSMLMRLGAEAGVNGGGFSDPNWRGNGFQPTGLVISGGQIFYDDSLPGERIDIVGFSEEGALIAGKYSKAEIAELGLMEAVSFRPRIIVNGRGLVKSDEDGWGIAPRTAVAQTADGTVLFAVIDGRQAHSLGATLYDVQTMFLEHGAVVAANLDGGSSAVLVTRDNDPKSESGFTIVNKPASQSGERFLPTAFLVFEHPERVSIGNIWEGLDMSKFDSSKW
jgi:exopolysaccharide biosynthesis protein